jgi:hypothetical protein
MPFSTPCRFLVAVDVELFGRLSTGMRRRQDLSLERTMTVREVAALVGVNPEEVGLIVINGIQGEMDDPVPLNCRLCFFPPMSGG